MYVVLYTQVYNVCSTAEYTMYVVLYAQVYIVCSTVCSMYVYCVLRFLGTF